MQLMIIGHEWKPLPLKGKSGFEFEFNHYANEKAWMTKEMFFSWLARLDRYIDRTTGCKILLLVSNCSAHGEKEGLPPLDSARLDFLPQSTTRKAQPLEAGIIAWIRASYNCSILFLVFENIYVAKNSICNVEVLRAMR